MTNKLPFLLLLISLAACLEPLDFDSELEEEFLVVDGTFTDSDESDQVYLSRAFEYGKQLQLPVEEATLTVYDERGNSEQLIALGKGIYEFQKQEVSGQIGESYYLEIELKDGKRYRSTPEQLNAAPPIDSLTFDVAEFEEVNDFGRIITRLVFQLSVNSIINSEGKNSFLRWETEHIYAFQQPYLYYIPFSRSFTCFVREPINTQSIYLIDGSDFSTDVSIKQEVASKTMNYTFNYAQSYRVSQYALNESAHTYWSRINQVSNLVGNIFDAPPAPVIGNLRNIDDENETVLGYFTVAGVSRQTFFSTAGLIAPFYRVSPYCGGPARTPTEVLEPACYGCLIIENSTFERPFYW